MRGWIFAAALAAAATPLHAAEPRRFQAQDLFRVVTADSPAVSPDGRWVAYVRVAPNIKTDKAERSLWLIPAKGGAARRIGEQAGEQSGPAWSPDGKTITYVATAPETKPRLMAVDLASFATRVIAQMAEKPSSLAWSPDGSRIAFMRFVPGEAPRLGKPLDKPADATWAEPLRIYDRLRWKTDDGGILKSGSDQLFVLGADGHGESQVTSGDFLFGDMGWDADSRSLVVSTNRDPDWQRQPDESDLWRYPVAGGEPVRLTARKGPDEAPAPSPDGKLLAWVGHDDAGAGYASNQLYVAGRDGSNPRSLTASLDRSVTAPVWSADAKSLLVSYGDGGRTRIARVTLDGKHVSLTDALGAGSIDRPYTGGSFDADGGTIAFTTADATHAGEIAVLGPAGKERRLTDLGGALAKERDFATIQPLRVTSKRDGKAIEAWIVLPPGYKGGKLPTILEVHGGPNAAYGPTFATDMQLYAAAGYAVIYPNARNSASYGDEFANWTRFDIPFADAQDMLSTVDAAVAAGFADPDNLFVTGGSYGGYASAMLIGLTDRFRAAAIQKPVIEWASKILTTDIAAGQAKSPYGANPWENPRGFWDNSPIALVAKVNTPALLIVGDKDYRTPMSQAEQYYTALKLRGVPSALVVVPGANHHGLAGRPSQNAARVSAILDWFDRYRKR